ncbi:HYD1 signature containing ADP-ribosyltransferase family protein [Acetivibrio clariflavus]|uniref:HYD1 signature containing ADP-ribosyltransferase family protein n=1 Tax=Acetivibrio clariflavus TaxID=288965 RepID=UPI000313827A|nr:HYD1 signature containing ADP-ribosyltransferase family protein [Acetivibrio clariflavus]
MTLTNQLTSVITKKNGVAISTTNYEYDANGNLTSSVTDGEKTTYAYDEFNQLISADGAKYGYNAEGYRVSKNVNGSLTRYIYEYDKVVLELNSSGNQVGRNIYGTNILMRTADGQSYYYMYNGHADVTALINAATGNIDATYYYDAFGNIVESTGVAKDKNSILYAGYQYDKETGLYYLNARMYDPKIARFLQEDTYTGDPEDPLSLNLYTYCANNPLIYYDPTGHFNIFSCEDWRKFARNAKEVGIGIADGTMRYISGNTYQNVGDFVNDVKWAYNNKKYLASGTASYITETASSIKQGSTNFVNDVKWAYNNRDIVAETIIESVQQFKSDVKWAIDNRNIVAQTTTEMATQAINEFKSKSLREKTAIATDFTLNFLSLVGAPEAAATKLAQIRKVDKLTDAINLMDKLYDAGAGMKRLDRVTDTITALRRTDRLVEASTGIRFIDNIDDFGKVGIPELPKNAIQKNYLEVTRTANNASSGVSRIKPDFIVAPGGVVYKADEFTNRIVREQDNIKILYHYTDEVGLNGILNSKKLKPSLKAVNPKDARYGNGQYLSDIIPGTKTPGQLSKQFINNPFQGKRFTYYIEIDVTDLNIIKGRDGVYVVLGEEPLDLTNRIVSSGKVIIEK